MPNMCTNLNWAFLFILRLKFRQIRPRLLTEKDIKVIWNNSSRQASSFKKDYLPFFARKVKPTMAHRRKNGPTHYLIILLFHTVATRAQINASDLSPNPHLIGLKSRL